MKRLLLVCAVYALWPSAAFAQMTMPPADLCAGEPGATVIPAGSTQSISSGSYGCVSVYGTLNLSGTVTVQTLHSHEGSLVRMTSGRLVTADVFPADADQFATGIIFEGRVEIEGGAKLSWTRLTAEVVPGSTQLLLAADPVGWVVGDEVFVPDTRDLLATPGLITSGDAGPEVRTITGIAGRIITLNQPFLREHPGARDAGGTLERFPAVANLKRSITITSANPQGVRGHLMVTSHATGYIRNVAIKDFGRTNNDPLNSTTNHIGRYAAHLHFLHMPGFEFSGNVVDQFTVWGVTVHHSNGEIIRQNVVTRGLGAGYMTEDGSETDNLFEENFCAEVSGRGDRGDEGQNLIPAEWGRNGSCYWFQGPHNRVVRNVANRGQIYGFTYWMGGPLREFADNEAMGGNTALALWYVWDGNNPIGPSFVDGFKAWNHQIGSYSYPTRNVIFRDLWVRGDPRVQNPGYRSSGAQWGDYEAKEQMIVRADIQNVRVGVSLPYGVSGGFADGVERVLLVDDSRFDGNFQNLWVASSAGAYDPAQVPPFTAVVRNSRHGAVRSGGAAIVKEFRSNPSASLVARQRIIVQSHEGVSGSDFEVFAPEQAPAFMIPGDGYSAGAAGLTNAAAWVQRQTAIFGAVAPCSSTRSGVSGFTCPVGSVPILPTITNTCTPARSVVDAGGNVWTFDSQKQSLRNGQLYVSWPGYAYVLHEGLVYFLSAGGWWGVAGGGAWQVVELPCRLTASPERTTLTNYPEFDGGYIIDADGNTWLVIDNPDPPLGNGIKGVVMLNGARAGTGLPGCCTILARATPPDQPYTMAFCNSQVYRQYGGTWVRWQGLTVYEWAAVGGIPCGLDGSEFCGDGVDNDHDGLVDEGCPPRAPRNLRLVTWFNPRGIVEKLAALAAGTDRIVRMGLRRYQ